MSMCRNFKIVSNSLVFLFLFPLLVESVETVKFDSAKKSVCIALLLCLEIH
jgi:hypothetical protein